MGQRAAESVELPHDQHVAGSDEFKRLRQAGAACQTHADPYLRRRNLLRGLLPHLFVFAHLVVRYLAAGRSSPPNFDSSGDHCNPRFRTLPVQVLPAKIVVVNRPR